MPDATGWQDILLSASKQCGIPLSTSDITAIRESDEQSELARWTRTSIGPNRLLSSEELDLWKHIERTRWRESSTTIDPLAISIPHDEISIAQAIASLEASTAAINTHSDVLEKQRSHLKAHHDRMSGHHAEGSMFAETLQRKRDLQAQQIKFLNSELGTNVEAQLRSIQDKADKALRSVPSMVSEKLDSDDRLLESLEYLTNKNAAIVESKFSAQQERIDNLITALEKATSLSLKDRLDRIYLEEVHKNVEDDTPHNQMNEQEIHQLTEDLQVLYAEIDDVAAMLTQHEHGNTLNKMLQSSRSSSAKQLSENKQKVHEKLLVLTQNLNDLAQRYESLRSHRIVLHQMQAHLKNTQDTHNPNVSPSKTSDTTGKPTGRPALTALMQHLDINPSMQRQSETTKNESLIAHQTTVLRQELDKIMPELQRAITNTVVQRARAIQSLATNVDADQIHDEQGQLIHELDQATMTAKLEVERIGETDAAEQARTEFIRKWGTINN